MVVEKANHTFSGPAAEVAIVAAAVAAVDFHTGIEEDTTNQGFAVIAVSVDVVKRRH